MNRLKITCESSGVGFVTAPIEIPLSEKTDKLLKSIRAFYTEREEYGRKAAELLAGDGDLAKAAGRLGSIRAAEELLTARLNQSRASLIESFRGDVQTAFEKWNSDLLAARETFQKARADFEDEIKIRFPRFKKTLVLEKSAMWPDSVKDCQKALAELEAQTLTFSELKKQVLGPWPRCGAFASNPADDLRDDLHVIGRLIPELETESAITRGRVSHPLKLVA